MILRADDFKDKSMFLALVEESQRKGLVSSGPLSFDEGDSVVNLDEAEVEVSIRSCNGKVY